MSSSFPHAPKQWLYWFCSCFLLSESNVLLREKTFTCGPWACWAALHPRRPPWAAADYPSCYVFELVDQLPEQQQTPQQSQPFRSEPSPHLKIYSYWKEVCKNGELIQTSNYNQRQPTCTYGNTAWIELFIDCWKATLLRWQYLTENDLDWGNHPHVSKKKFTWSKYSEILILLTWMILEMVSWLKLIIITWTDFKERVFT